MKKHQVFFFIIRRWILLSVSEILLSFIYTLFCVFSHNKNWALKQGHWSSFIWSQQSVYSEHNTHAAIISTYDPHTNATSDNDPWDKMNRIFIEAYWHKPKYWIRHFDRVQHLMIKLKLSEYREFRSSVCSRKYSSQPLLIESQQSHTRAAGAFDSFYTKCTFRCKLSFLKPVKLWRCFSSLTHKHI